MKTLDIQTKALIISTIILTVLFSVMFTLYGFRSF